jgi:N-acetyl-alpha-D-muramate 1-phosphate uridylyltransferase
MPTPQQPAIAAMVLAAGRGNRMRPLTDHTPKPLLPVHGKPLMLWLMDALQASGFQRVLVNTAWLGEQIAERLGTWALEHPQAELAFSHEEEDFGYALETAGGIARALPSLGEVFWVLFSRGTAWRASPPAARWRTSGSCPTQNTTRAATSA